MGVMGYKGGILSKVVPMIISSNLGIDSHIYAVIFKGHSIFSFVQTSLVSVLKYSFQIFDVFSCSNIYPKFNFIFCNYKYQNEIYMIILNNFFVKFLVVTKMFKTI